MVTLSFGERYEELGRRPYFAQTMKKVRLAYRNRAVHCEGDFGANRYQRLVGLVFGAESVGEWVCRGPSWEAPDPRRGLVEHHVWADYQAKSFKGLMAS